MTGNLRILHVMRAPVGGLFRHVLDLSREQARSGHAIGIIADSNASDALTRERLASAVSHLELGVTLIPMGRRPGLSDIGAVRAVAQHVAKAKPDVVHGHGAKGGAYARAAASKIKSSAGRPVAAFYTPHGGTLNFDPRSLEGRIYHGIERLLARRTAGLIFESDYARRQFLQHIGDLGIALRVIPNGLSPEDFAPHAPEPGAADFLFVGELRDLKGVDALLRALRILNAERPARAIIVGSGPDEAKFRHLATELGLDGLVSFTGAMPARSAFRLGRCLVVPSLKESFPYIVLEGAAARLPLVATHVGGIPEMVAGTPVQLVEPGNVAQLADAMRRAVSNRDDVSREVESLAKAVAARFTVDRMTADVLDFYAFALSR